MTELMTKLILTLAVAAIPATLSAVEPTDSVTTNQLEEVVVEGASQRQEAQKAVYLPDKLQKETALSATDLLNRMQIPQLSPGADGTPVTAGGQSVTLFVNYLPADQRELEGLRTGDVVKVEYYDYPSDPRFKGAPHVVNFIMKQYDYGGYVKLYGTEHFWWESGQLSFTSKVQYKKMTYDLYGGAWHYENNHRGEAMTEYFRLPQADGSFNDFERQSDVLGAKYRNRQYWTTFRALWQTDRVTMRNSIGANWNHTPTSDQHGMVTYTPDEWPTDEYAQTSSSRINGLSYSGDWFFQLPHNNSLNFAPTYSYLHTNQNSSYAQPGIETLLNGARDDTHQLQATLNYSHSFDKGGTLGAALIGIYSSNKTTYTGTANSTDRSDGWAIVPAVEYSIALSKVYINANLSLGYMKTDFVGKKENRLTPGGYLSVQYAPNQKNSLSAQFNYSTSTPETSYVSTNIIQVNPLMSYTGNPDLKSYHNYYAYLGYTFTPSRKFNFSVYASHFSFDNRFVYVYRATPTGIIRTIEQHHSKFRNWGLGANASTSQLDNKLQISAGVQMSIVENGQPYDWTKVGAYAWLRAYYYLGNWYFGLSYTSPDAAYDGYMNGVWTHTDSDYSVSAGWSKHNWNLRATFANFGAWGWTKGHKDLESDYYSYRSTIPGGHAYFSLSAAYTFGFGKQIRQGDEAQRIRTGSSGILK